MKNVTLCSHGSLKTLGVTLLLFRKELFANDLPASHRWVFMGTDRKQRVIPTGHLNKGLPKHLDAEEAAFLPSSHICASRVNQKLYAVWPWSSQVYSRYCSTAEALGRSVPCAIPATTGQCLITLRFIFCVFQKAHEHYIQKVDLGKIH